MRLDLVVIKYYNNTWRVSFYLYLILCSIFLLYTLFQLVVVRLQLVNITMMVFTCYSFVYFDRAITIKFYYYDNLMINYCSSLHVKTCWFHIALCFGFHGNVLDFHGKTTPWWNQNKYLKLKTVTVLFMTFFMNWGLCYYYFYPMRINVFDWNMVTIIIQSKCFYLSLKDCWNYNKINKLVIFKTSYHKYLLDLQTLFQNLPLRYKPLERAHS